MIRELTMYGFIEKWNARSLSGVIMEVNRYCNAILYAASSIYRSEESATRMAQSDTVVRLRADLFCYWGAR